MEVRQIVKIGYTVYSYYSPIKLLAVGYIKY